MSGFLIIVAAALVWGIGNAVTGYTAYHYAATGSLFPAIDIALANTVGGLIFLIPAKYLSRALAENSSALLYHSVAQRYSRQALLASMLKGSNTCLFVFSTMYIAATQSLVLESTYIVWSLVLTMIFTVAKPKTLIAKAVLIFLAATLVSGQSSLQLNTKYHMLGAVFGIIAGMTYAGFLFFWSQVTAGLDDLPSLITSTGVLQMISLLSILVFSEFLSLILLGTWWMPLRNLNYPDILLQMVNGIFVIGVTYLLLTVGMARLKELRQGASTLAALGLSFSIPFTLLPEYMIGKFHPTAIQIAGLILFMIGFIILTAESKASTGGQS